VFSLLALFFLFRFFFGGRLLAYMLQPMDIVESRLLFISRGPLCAPRLACRALL
jgi:hypothetical protein